LIVLNVYALTAAVVEVRHPCSS